MRLAGCLPVGGSQLKDNGKGPQNGPPAARHQTNPLGVQGLQHRALELGQELSAMPAIAVAGVLRAVVGAGRETLVAGLAAEREAVLATMGTKDQQEGMRAFLEKRRPVQRPNPCRQGPLATSCVDRRGCRWDPGRSCFSSP